MIWRESKSAVEGGPYTFIVTSRPVTDRAINGANRSIKFAWHVARSSIGKLLLFFHETFAGNVGGDDDDGAEGTVFDLVGGVNFSIDTGNEEW